MASALMVRFLFLMENRTAADPPLCRRRVYVPACNRIDATSWMRSIPKRFLQKRYAQSLSFT